MIGSKIHDLATKLWKFNRSITGNGVRQTLKIIQELIPGLVVNEIPTGTLAFDWEIPMEWNVESAYIIDPNGKIICDFSQNNLHLVGYSAPIDTEGQEHYDLENEKKYLFKILKNYRSFYL